MSAAINGLIPAGQKAPRFVLPPAGLAGASESRARDVTLPDPQAPGLDLIIFFKNTCPTCRLALPFAQRLHDALAPRGGRVYGVSQDGREGARSLASELALSLPILVDGEDYPVSRLYDLVSVPTLYLVRPDGTIVRSGAGFSRSGLDAMAADMADSLGAPRPSIFHDGENVPESKPG